MELVMEFAFVAAMGGVGLEDVAVAGSQFFEDAGLVDDTGATVVGKCAEKDGILAVFGIHGTEFAEVLSQEGICLFLSELYASAVWLSRLDLVAISNVRPVPRFMERLKMLDYQNCPFKERKLHYAPLCGGGRCRHKGQQRHEE